jgi:type I restriction enzyme M protein
MPIKKSELYSSLWQSCDALRGGMDASQYKDYVLVLLFMKYVSDKAASQGDYLLDVPPGASFADMSALKGQPNIGEGINVVIAKLAEANDSLRGAIDVANFNDPDKLGKGKDMVDRLTSLITIFENPALDFRGNRADGDDLLGDAYEYLMRHFATESGKSKGQFYTPAEVSRIMAAVIGLDGARSGDQSIYDPACGSGSLLLKAHDEAKNATGLDLAIYGQEMDNATAGLAKMNMVLHDAPTAEIANDNTLSSPQFKNPRTDGLKTFDWVVANPPFSTKTWTNGFNPAEDLYQRFPYGLPPKKNGDYAFLLHILASLKSTGKAAVILPHGVLFRGNSEATIRREIIRRGYVEGIIGLPANLFYGTGIPACVVVLDKEGAEVRNGIFMIDASRGFAKDGNKNRLRAQDIHRIVDTFTRQAEGLRFARMVSLVEIERNDFNLNITRYIDSSDPEDVQDVDGHLRGGIPFRDLDALDRYWQVFPAVRDALFELAGRDGYSRLRVSAGDIKSTIFENDEFAVFNQAVVATFETWRAANRPRLSAFDKGSNPNELIAALSEDLLASFRPTPLVNAYDVYQRLMEFWESVFRDDAYLIAEVGWVGAATPRLIIETPDQKSNEQADFVVGKLKFKSDLVPADLLVGRYLAAEKAVCDTLKTALADADLHLAELAVEHGSEGGLLEGVVGDNGKITKQAVASRLKELDADDEDEKAQLVAAQAILVRQATAKSGLKAATDRLNAGLAHGMAGSPTQRSGRSSSTTNGSTV